MAIETEPGTIQQPGGADPGAPGPVRAWWMRPAVHTAIIGAVVGYAFGHWLGNLITSGYPQAGTGGGSPDVERHPDRARLPVHGDRLADRARHLQRPGQPDARQAAARLSAARRRRHRPGQVLQVHPRPQGGGHPVPGRHGRLLLHGRPVRDGDQDRAAVAGQPRVQLQRLHRDRRRARHDDDDADDVGHPRAVRQLPGPADDRVQAGRVPAARGAVVLADADRVPGPAVGDPARRLPHGLDRLPVVVGPGRARAPTPTRSRSG